MEEELRETRLVWERDRRSEKKRGMQSGHLLYHSRANNGQTGVGFLINKRWNDNIMRVAELVLCIYTNIIILRRRAKQLLQRHGGNLMKTKPLHDSDERLQW
ncbi:MAG: hypothetical protein M3H12_01235 [Chromatiales bacterium]